MLRGFHQNRLVWKGGEATDEERYKERYKFVAGLIGINDNGQLKGYKGYEDSILKTYIVSLKALR